VEAGKYLPFLCQRLCTDSNQTTGEEQQIWRNRTEGFLKAALVFFTGANATDTNRTVMYEAACERSVPGEPMSCNTDQRSFKAYLSRWLAATTLLAPWTADTIMPLLQNSALAAAQSCSGGSDGVTCGNKWWVAGWDGLYGVGEQISALEVIQSNLVVRSRGPLSDATGGTSGGDPNAGSGSVNGAPKEAGDVSPSDRKGAIALTVMLVFITLGAAW
jgi:mannan endo-1,6-alpha-mannosidase